MTVLVWADGVKVDGTVTVYDGTTVVGTGTVGKHGVVKIKLSKLSVGSHELTAVYEGNDTFNSSSSSSWPVYIWR